MVQTELTGLMLGAIALGAVHGVEPGHGWPVAASYALDRSNKWFYGFASSFILGLGHLVSSIAMVGVFFYAKSYFELTQIDEPTTLVEGLNVAGIIDVQVGGPVSLVAGVLLIALGLREYYGGGHSHDHGGGGDDEDDDAGHGADAESGHDHGDLQVIPDHDAGHGHDVDHAHGEGHDHEEDHEHGHGDDHDHESDHGHAHGEDNGHGHDDHGHDDHAHSNGGLRARVMTVLPFVGGHSHGEGDLEEATDRGLLGIAWFAFVLGFAHEEEFEIIALCAGSVYCLELMLAYAMTVIVGIVGLTMLLIAGYENHEEKVEKYTPYLPAFSAAVLIIMGLGFITGIF